MAMVKHTLVSIAILAAVSLGLGGPVLPHGSEQVAPRDRLEPDFAGYAFVYVSTQETMIDRYRRGIPVHRN